MTTKDNKSKTTKMIAVFELEFEAEDMFDEEAIMEDFGGDWNKAMKWLYDQENMGIFDNSPKLISVKPKMNPKPKLDPLGNAFSDFLEGQGHKVVDVTVKEDDNCVHGFKIMECNRGCTAREIEKLRKATNSGQESAKSGKPVQSVTPPVDERWEEDFEDMRTNSYEDPIVLSDEEAEQIKSFIRLEKDKSWVEGYKACGCETGKQAGIAYVGFQEKLDKAYEQGRKEGVRELAKLIDREVILPFGGNKRKRQRTRLDEVVIQLI